jgi:hypothetical protein
VRGAFLALVAINIVFFAWAQWIDVPARPPASIDRDAGIPPLQLEMKGNAAASLPSGASAAAASPVAAATAPMGSTPDMTAESAPSTRCRSLGPFDDVNAANAAADRLRTRGMNPHDRSAETVNPNVYWVYIGELTVELQRRAIQTLNSAGIHDAVAMTQPEQSDRVSVGVFADQAHAVRRAEQVSRARTEADAGHAPAYRRSALDRLRAQACRDGAVADRPHRPGGSQRHRSWARQILRLPGWRR